MKEVGAALPIRVDAWDIGGAPMVFRGLKAGTKDIDLVVDTNEARDAIGEALKKMGYQSMWDMPEHRGMEGVFLRKQGHVGVDVFVRQIMRKFCLSEGMKVRADPLRQFGNLVVSDCANEDIFLLKSLTHRPDDDNDVLVLAGTGLNATWMREELALQKRLSDEVWSEVVYRELGEIEQRTGVAIAIKERLLD